jgi:hypothetical protein
MAKWTEKDFNESSALVEELSACLVGHTTEISGQAVAMLVASIFCTMADAPGMDRERVKQAGLQAFVETVQYWFEADKQSNSSSAPAR